MADSSFQETYSTMQELYGADGCQEILESFIDESKKLISQLKAADTGGDNKECARLAHQFKGLASVVTHEEMIATSLTLEKSANEHDWSKWAELLAQLDGHLSKLLTDINQCLKKDK
jgi:HPt (histidine-containing phosphotransfer) domain-containing protein